MDLSLLLFGICNGIALLSCLWAITTAALPAVEHSGRHRAVTLLAGIVAPCAILALAITIGRGGPLALVAVAALAPIAIAAGIWSSLITLRHQGLGLKVLYLPLLAWNSLLAGVYGIRVLQDTIGTDLGSFGSAVVAAHARVQCLVGSRGAEQDPVWLHLPLLLPLSLQFATWQRAGLVAFSTVSSGLLALACVAMPDAYQRVKSFRGQGIDVAAAALPPIGVSAPWGKRLLAAGEREELRARLAALGAAHVVVDVSPDTFADEQLARQAVEEIGFARRAGLAVVVVTRPPGGAGPSALRNLGELKGCMAQAHWFAAEKLQPDLLVLYAGPFGQLQSLTVQAPTLPQWLDTIRQSAREARQANADIRLGVVIDTRAPHAAELFRQLKADDSPVDSVALSAAVGNRTFAEWQAVLTTMQRWCERTPGARGVQVIGIQAQAPLCGGALGQWHAIAQALRSLSAGSGFASLAIVDLLEANPKRTHIACRELSVLLPRRVAPAAPR
jgi:hypothetical protein